PRSGTCTPCIGVAFYEPARYQDCYSVDNGSLQASGGVPNTLDRPLLLRTSLPVLTSCVGTPQSSAHAIGGGYLSQADTHLDGNQHTAGTHGKSQRWRAWHWRLTDSQPTVCKVFGFALLPSKIFGGL